MRKFRTTVEQEVGKNIGRIFNDCPDPVEVNLENFEVRTPAAPETFPGDV
jgi:hypothetical protein